ncbi:MAG: gliding motility protein GldL [Paludibacteraceae bacterium]|jgi:gliding motility-associated protein GldL|nr:gliding motility protein GldL [Paludibacteraceae bacterium]
MAKEMTAGNSAEKKGFGARFMRWYGSYQGKRVVGMVYSIGASVVIIGALFKIMHFPGAGAVLMIGMITEALLFMIGCLDKPHPEFHWHEVFPQLLGHGTEPELLKEMQSRPKPTLMGGGAGEGGAAKSANVPALSEKDMDALKDGIAGLAKTAVQLSELGKVATATAQLSEKLDAAGQAAEQFVVAGKAISEKSEALSATYGQVNDDMKKVAAGTKEYEAQVAAVAKQLNSLNAVYELQVNAVQAQVEAYKAQSEKVNGATQQIDGLTATVKKMSDVSAEALKAQEAYEAAAKKLANQVADLNKVYGNMLSALS